MEQTSQSPFGRIVVLTGARQTGKTTLARQLFTNYTYISLDDPVTRSKWRLLTSQQWQNTLPLAILDEVQKEPTLVDSIKAVYDASPEVRYVLLGSSQLLLLEKVKESLAGRCAILEVYPLTLPELATHAWEEAVPLSLWQSTLTGKPLTWLPDATLDTQYASKQKAWSHYQRWGGYPALTQEVTDQERQLWLDNYVRTYLERDVRDLANFRDLDAFGRLQHRLALGTATLLNASTLGTELGLSHKTVQRYLRYFELSYQALQLLPWSKNPTKRLTKTPKLHYLDQGVLRSVLKREGPLTGQEFESLVVAEVFKQARALGLSVNFWHFRTLDGREVDLLVETPQGYFALEVKMSERVSSVDGRGLKGLAEFLDKPLLGSFVLSNDSVTRELSPGITAIQAAYFLG